MLKIFFLILLLGGGLFLFNLYDPFDMKLFDEEKEVVVETKKPVEKKALTAKDFFLKGKENLKANNYKMAISNFSRTLELDPNYVEAYKERALAKDKNGDFEGSKKDYEKYILMFSVMFSKISVDFFALVSNNIGPNIFLMDFGIETVSKMSFTELFTNIFFVVFISNTFLLI